MEGNIIIRPISENDKNWVAKVLKNEWGSTVIFSKGNRYQADTLPGFVAEKEDKQIGLVIYTVKDKECEIIALKSLYPGKGTGTKLVNRVKDVAKETNCKKIAVVTTNDNTSALRFYQKKGFRMVALYIDSVTRTRKLKPEIPEIGMDGIPLKDEIELELLL